ncbi:PrgI family mobile element protein [Hamadaea sp. NPDC050747]|uniref:PrgI family mobile element protein n=1 Tax=Hamadaea sp. NPDC050747 TaxID=3155789 RepID=UPI0033C13D90
MRAEEPVDLSTPMPADLDTPDKVAWGLTFRQVAILAAGAAAAWLAYRTVAGALPPPVWLVLAVPYAALLFAVAVGRRDGLSLDRWLGHAITYLRAGKLLAPGMPGQRVPVDVDGRTPKLGPLRLPADAISPAGLIRHGGQVVGVVAASTINLELRAPAEQAALLAGLGRWLNTLSTPTQIVVSTRRWDLSPAADALVDRAETMPDGPLRDTALDHAAFLYDIAEQADPLRRQILIVHTGRDPAAVSRMLAGTAATLRGLGATTRVLDGPTVTGVLAAACDPYRPPAEAKRAVPGQPVGTCAPSGRNTPDTLDTDIDVTVACGPSVVKVTSSAIVVGDDHAATFAITGYPPEVGPGWLAALFTLPLWMDAAVHIEPIPAPVAADFLRRQRARLESSRRLDAGSGKLADPTVDAVAADAAGLADRVARGAGHLSRTGIYLTVHARTGTQLAEATTQLQAAASGMLLDLRPVTWRQLQGWTATLPLGVDPIGMRRMFDTDSLAAAFPFAASDLPAPLPGDPPATGGQLYGLTAGGTGVTWWDRWSAANHNQVVLARSGAGKSYLTKLEILRALPHGIGVSVVDPDDEYAALAAQVGGVTIALGAPGVRFNPLDLPTGIRRPDELDRRIGFLHTLLDVMLAGRTGDGLTADEHTIVDKAAIACYRTAGITADPDTWGQPAPLLADLADTLRANGDPAWTRLADRLTPWTHGSHSALFAGQTTTRPGGQLTVWSLRQLADEIRPIGMLLALDAIDTLIDTPGSDGTLQRRLVVVDEAWLLMRDGEGAKFLLKMAKSARKRGAGLTVVTQDTADLLSSDLGMAVVNNSATQILLQQSAQAIDIVADRFALTAGEARALLTAEKGTALLVCGASRTLFQVVASRTEDSVARTGLSAVSR